ncbi:kinase-like domain-containing protein [Mycena polygramma]|nr:kinase-like domain-containing protein [Mycena polygramma]
MALHDYFGLRLPGQEKMITKALVHQLMQGIAFIHARGIAHGDLHPRNIGVALPELEAFTEIQIWKTVCRPDLLPLLPYDPTRDPDSFPPYLCEAIDLGDFVLKQTPNLAARGPPRVRILDLGHAYFVETSPPPPCVNPLTFRPPEVIFPRLLDRKNDGHWDRRSDIWSLACMLYDIVSAKFLFARSWLGPDLNDSLIRMMAMGCGGVPDNWAEYLAVPATEFTSEKADAFWKEVPVPDVLVEDAPGYLRLLRRMLVIDPEQRPTAEELLQDPYFDGLQSDAEVTVADRVFAELGLVGRRSLDQAEEGPG